MHPDREVYRWPSVGWNYIGLDEIPSHVLPDQTNAAAERHPSSVWCIARNGDPGSDLYGYLLRGGGKYIIVALADSDL
jgi:hypothetical protein